MKHLVYYSVMLFILTLFSGTILAQSINGNGKEINKQKKVQNTSQTQEVNLNGDVPSDNSGTQKLAKEEKRKKNNKGHENDSMSSKASGKGDKSRLRPQDGTGFSKGKGHENGSGKSKGKSSKKSSKKNWEK